MNYNKFKEKLINIETKSFIRFVKEKHIMKQYVRKLNYQEIYNLNQLKQKVTDIVIKQMYRHVDLFETIFMSPYMIDLYPFTFKGNKLDEYVTLSKILDDYRNTYRTNKLLQIQFLTLYNTADRENKIHNTNTI